MHLRHASKCMYTCKYMLTHSHKHMHTHTLSHCHTLSHTEYILLFMSMEENHKGKNKWGVCVGGGGDKQKSILGYLVFAVCPICAQSIATTVTHRSCQNKNTVHRPFDTKISVNSKSSDDSQSILKNKMSPTIKMKTKCQTVAYQVHQDHSPPTFPETKTSRLAWT